MTGIWKSPATLAQLNGLPSQTMHRHLGIEFTQIGSDFLTASMPVDWRTKQPYGVLHGGASVALAETVGSVAANLCLEAGQICFGLDINASHIRQVKQGYVWATARACHLGRTTQIWWVDMTNDRQQRTCHARLTMVIMDAPDQESPESNIFLVNLN